MTTKRPRPDVVDSCTIKKDCGCGTLYTTITWDENGPLEVFTKLGKEGSCPYCLMEALTRSITGGLRYGVPLEVYKKQLFELKCDNSKHFPREDRAFSCADALSRSISTFIDNRYWEESLKTKEVDKVNIAGVEILEEVKNREKGFDCV